MALALDAEPTYGYLPPVYYYQGRVREGLKTAGFTDSYKTYLEIRSARRRGSAPRRRPEARGTVTNLKFRFQISDFRFDGSRSRSNQIEDFRSDPKNLQSAICDLQ